MVDNLLQQVDKTEKHCYGDEEEEISVEFIQPKSGINFNRLLKALGMLITVEDVMAYFDRKRGINFKSK